MASSTTNTRPKRKRAVVSYYEIIEAEPEVESEVEEAPAKKVSCLFICLARGMFGLTPARKPLPIRAQ